MATSSSKDHKCTTVGDQIDKNMCDLCSRSGRQTIATVFCETCKGNMCNDCCVKHMMYAIGDHNITDINNSHIVDETNHPEVENSSDFEENTQAQPLQLLKTLDIKSISTNYRGQLRASVTALDFLSDGRLVALDFNREMCYLFDEQLNGCIGWYTFESTPVDLACYEENNVAVTL